MDNNEKSGSTPPSSSPSGFSEKSATKAIFAESKHISQHITVHDSLQSSLERQKQLLNALNEKHHYFAREYNHLVQLTNTSFLTISRAGYIIDCNPVAAKILEKSPAFLPHAIFANLLDTSDSAIFNSWIEKAWLTNTELYLPVKLRLQNNKVATIEIQAFTSQETNTAKLYISLQNTQEQQRKRESEEKYKTLIEQAYDGVIIYDFTGAILDFNDKAHNYLGYTHQEFEKLTLTDLFYDEDIAKNPITFNKLKEGKAVVDHRKLKRKDGTGIEMEINSKMMPDGTVIVFGRDITQRIKEAAEMQRLSKIIQNSRDEIFLLNSETLLFEYANDAALKSVGYNAEELYQLTPAEIKWDYPPNALSEVLAPLKNGEQEKVYFETHHQRKDKTKYPAEVYVQLIDIGSKEVFLYNSRDITERKKAAVELLEKEKYFRTLIEHSSSAIILFDAAGNFIYQSPVVEKIVGYPGSEASYSNLLHFIHPDDEQPFLHKLGEILKTPGGTVTGQYRFKHEQGHYVWLEGTVTNLLDIEYIHALIGNYQDISERKEAEELLKAERLLLRTLIDNLPDPIYVKDVEGRKIIANKEDQIFMALACEEDAIGKTDLELYPGKWGEAGHAFDLAVMETGIAEYEKEIFYTDRNGKEHWLLVSKIPLQNAAQKVIGVLGIGRNITVRKQMEGALVKSNERYQYITMATFDAVWDWDISAGTVYRGEGFETLFGYDLKMHDSKKGEWEQLIHQDDIKRVLDSFETALQSNAVNWQNEYRYKKANEEYATVIDKAIIIRNNVGKAIRMIGAMQDITQQKHVQQKLVEAEGRFRALVENSTDGIAILEEDGQPNYLSPSMQRILGYSVEEGMVLNKFTLVHPDDKIEMEKSFQYAVQNPGLAVKGYTFRIKHKDGSWRWLDDTITNMLHVPAINGFIENFRDVTEKLIIENRIITEKDLSDSLINNLPGIFFQIINNRLYRWNKNFEVLCGYTPDELKYLQPVDLFTEQHKGSAAAFFARSQHETTTVTELLFITKQNEAIPFYFNAISLTVANEECIIVMGFDIRDRKEKEEKLRISNERFEYVSKATFDAVWDWDIENRELVLGENFGKYFGYVSGTTKSNLSTWNNNIHPDDYVRISNSLEKVIEGPENIWVDEYRFRRFGGDYAYVQDRGIAIRNSNGKAIRMIGAMHDVTEQKRDEEKVKLLNEQLAVKAFALSSSNNELEKFAYVASHDLQEPLRMISSFLQLLQRKYEHQLDDTARKYIHFAVDGADRMKTLINDLLEYSRVSTAKDASGNTDMNEVMDTVKAIFIISIEEAGAVIHCDHLPVLPGTQKTLMIQLMQNLIGNALKYHSTSEPVITVKAHEEESNWVFSVTDNGIGIDPAFEEKIFVIFQRLHNKDEFSGTGIGLSICKKIVEMHGGRIWVEQNKAGGSTFYFTISKAF